MTPQEKLETFIEYFKTFANICKADNIITYTFSINSKKNKTVRKNGKFFKQDRYFTFGFNFSEYELENIKRGKSIFLELIKQLTVNEKIEKRNAYKSFGNFSDLTEENIIKIFQCLDKYLFIKGSYKEDFEEYLNKKELIIKLNNKLEIKETKTKIVKI